MNRKYVGSSSDRELSIPAKHVYCLDKTGYDMRSHFIPFLILCLIAQSQVSFGQTTVSGIVTSEDGEPLIGVNVVSLQSSQGTVTGIDGDYSIVVSAPDTLVFSYIGYATQKVPLDGRTEVDVVLDADVEILEEVVVTGYKKEIKSNIATAISSIKSEDIEKLPVLGLDQALQGQVSGLQVTQATGAPGDDVAVRIRGVGTIGNNDPLFVIDGVPTTGALNMFSTSDIESIEVLKDGAAAAIYGARAANGVILITTKKGSEGKPQINLQSYFGMQEANRLPELLNASEYLVIRNEAITNANTLRDPIRQMELYDPAILNDLPDVNWLDEVFRIAPTQKHILSASGGSESGQFYVMGEYFNQEGVFKGQGFNKYLLRFNGEITSDKLQVGNNISISFTDRDVIGSSGDGAGPGNELSGIRYALIAAPVVPIRDDKGEFIPTTSQLGDPFLYGDGNANPLAFIEATDWDIQRYRFFGNVFVAYHFLPELTFRSNLGADLLFSREKIFKERLSAAIYDPTSLSESQSTNRNLVWNNTLDFTKNFSRHRISGLLGMEVIQNRTDLLGASARNFFTTTPNFRFIDNGLNQDLGDVDAGGIASEWGLLSYFGQLGYSYGNRYVINAALRRDGSSRFGSENRWGLFPSLSLAWNVSSESFFDVPFISHLKLRASYGELGNQEIGLYPFSSLVEIGSFVYPNGAGGVVTGAKVVETGNENIKWETTTQIDVGMELSLFNDQISIVADYYQKNTTDMLVRVPLPQTAGDVNPPFVNAGEVENKGLELSLSFRQSAKDFKYQVTGNISTVKNEVIALSESEPILGGFGLSDGPITKTEPGHPIGSFFVYDAIGIFQSMEEVESSPFQTEDTRPGDIKFADLNGDNVIDDKDRAHLGNPFPDFIYGLNANFNWRNFDLSLFFQGVQGNDVYFLYGNFAYETQSRGFNSYRAILDRWTPEKRDTDIPKVSIDDRNGNRRISTRFLEDGSYLRLKNITLGYDVGKLFRSQERIRGLRVYLTAQNALTWTNYSGLDPEIQANTNDTQGFGVSSDLAVGIDWGTVPAPRIFIFGLNLGI